MRDALSMILTANGEPLAVLGAAPEFATRFEGLKGSKRKALEDPKHVFGFQNVAPIVKQSVIGEEGPQFAATINRVSALLTIPAIQQMNKAVTIDKQSATSVAAQFLKANGLT